MIQTESSTAAADTSAVSVCVCVWGFKGAAWMHVSFKFSEALLGYINKV